MSGGIEEPYTIAVLPSPLDAGSGRILAAPVYSLSGSRKRKRHEIAVAIDGESINIYNARNQSLSSSYPLPPQCYLAAPPCSIYCKRTSSAHRQTYFPVRDAPDDQKLRLLSITEELGKLEKDVRVPRIPMKRERKLRAGSIIGLDTIRDDSLLVSYTNGNIDCLASDLSGAKWAYTGEEDLYVEYSVILDSATAHKGVLKGREDILAILDQKSSEGDQLDTVPVLLQVLRIDHQRQVRINALRNTQGEMLQTQRTPMEKLVSYNLPGPGSSKDKLATYEFHTGTGMLYQHLGHILNIFDLSGTLPRLMATLGRKGVTPRVNGFARLSPTTVFTVSFDRLSVCETKFSSVLSSLEYPSGGMAGWGPQLQIVSQFTELSVVVALSGVNLIAFQIGDILDDGRRARAHAPLLIDVLGKGSKPDARDVAKSSGKSSKKRQRLDNWKAKVDEFIAQDEIESLEDLIAQDLRIRDNDDALKGGLANGPHSDVRTLQEGVTWDLPPHAYDPQHTDSSKALYVVGSLFRWHETDGQSGANAPQLTLKFLSKNILLWLAMAGYLTHTRVEKALHGSSGRSATKPHVAPGDIVAALKHADPSFTTVCDLLSLPIHWDLVEVTRGLQLLVRSFEAKAHTPAVGFLTGPSGDDDDDVVMANCDVESQVQAEVDAATRQLDEVQSMLDSGLTTRSKTCQVMLFRMHAFPHAEVSRVMRALFSQEELIFFIAILRLELGDAGWTKKYVEGEQSTDQEFSISKLDNPADLEPSNHAIRTIADLCSCAIDAIGLSGWLVGLSGDLDETARLISEMRTEIYAAAEGMVGVEVLETMLGEMMKVAAGSVSPDEEAEFMLPLGSVDLRARLKLRKEGVDGRRMAEERSRAVGKYSFEQIRL